MSYKVEIPCEICHKDSSIISMKVAINPLTRMNVWVCSLCWKQRPSGTIEVSMELQAPEIYTIHKN